MSSLRKTAAKPAIMPRLSAPLTAMRRQFLNAVKSLPAEDAMETLRKGLAQETSELARLGNLAAQSWIVRQRLTALQEQTGTLVRALREDAAAEPASPPAEGQAATPEPVAQTPTDTPIEPQPAAPEGWRKLRITNETEVNGMIFFAGSTIQVQEDDAEKLVASGHAEVFVQEAEPGKSKRKSKASAKKDG